MALGVDPADMNLEGFRYHNEIMRRMKRTRPNQGADQKSIKGLFKMSRAGQDKFQELFFPTKPAPPWQRTLLTTIVKFRRAHRSLARESRSLVNASATGERLITAGNDSTVILWSTRAPATRDAARGQASSPRRSSRRTARVWSPWVRTTVWDRARPVACSSRLEQQGTVSRGSFPRTSRQLQPPRPGAVRDSSVGAMPLPNTTAAVVRAMSGRYQR